MTKDNIPRWPDKDEYPFISRYFMINGQRQHYVDEGLGPVLLFVHGTPSWSFDFRKAIIRLKNDFRCIAPDHIGFGLSDKPERYDYSTLNHSKTLEQFVMDNRLKKITLIVHDFGGPIGLGFAIRRPELVEKLVILNSWLWSSEGDPEFKRLSWLLKSPLTPFLYKRFNFSPRYMLPASFGRKKPDKKILKHYTKPFANASQRHGVLAFARSLLHDQQWFEALWNTKDAIAFKPTLFIWGMKDPLITPKYLEKFETGFPSSITVKLEAAGHFPQEEEPEKLADAIHDFAVQTS